ncbi:MAG: methylmalonyl-CoA epimerase [Candidatus Sericytochromatia bacterium]|nr:methylmalonyl-CoA epimerase [Candidatus Tanganyikabacteria bacterium]
MSTESSLAPRQVDHLGIAVHSLDAALPFWRDVLGLTFVGFEDVPDQKVRVAVLLAGPNRIELLEPTAEDSPVRKFLNTRGEGIHHVALRVDACGATLDHLASAGVRLIDAVPRTGAEGARIGFVHPKATGGILLEVSERPEGTGHGVS